MRMIYEGVMVLVSPWWCEAPTMCSRRPILMESTRRSHIVPDHIKYRWIRLKFTVQQCKTQCSCAQSQCSTYYNALCRRRVHTVMMHNNTLCIVQCFLNINSATTQHSPLSLNSERVVDNAFGRDRSYFTLTPSTASKCPFLTFIK